MYIGIHGFFKWLGIPGKVILTSFISLLAVVLAFVDPTATRILCVPAMIISSIGDLILMDYRPFTSKLPIKGFNAGAVTFAASHLLYFAAFFSAVTEKGHNYFNIGAFFGIFISLSIVLWMSIRCLAKNGNKKMLPLGVIYALFISLNLVTVFSCAASMGGMFIVSAVGVVSFLISDLLIAADVIFNIKIKNSDALIWIFYPIGQLLLIIGA